MYNTSTLVDAVKRNILATGNNFKFQDPDFISFLNEELQWLVQNVFISLNEDFFIEEKIIALVANQTRYQIPYNAASMVLYEVYYKDSSGVYNRLPRWSRRAELQGSNTSSIPNAFYIEDNNIVLVPSMSTSVSGSLVVSYQRIINQLIDVTSCGVVQSVTTAGTNYNIVVDSVPSNYTLGVDVISKQNPYELIGKELTATVGGFTITVDATNFERAPIAGDYIAQTGFTPIPHIPSEYHPVLAQAGAVRVLEAMGDTKNYQPAQQRLSAMIETLKNTARNRAKSSPKKLVNRNWILDGMRFRRRWF